jgi:hypothetical protein
MQVVDSIGGRTRTRTWDPLIKSQLLYQLSYAPARLDGSAPHDGREGPSGPPEGPAI